MRLRRMSQHKLQVGLDWMGWKSLGGVKYRAAYTANKVYQQLHKKHPFMDALFPKGCLPLTCYYFCCFSFATEARLADKKKLH